MKKRIDFRVFFSKILDIKVSNVDIACLHQRDKDVETDSEKILIFIFFIFDIAIRYLLSEISNKLVSGKYLMGKKSTHRGCWLERIILP